MQYVPITELFFHHTSFCFSTYPLLPNQKPKSLEMAKIHDLTRDDRYIENVHPVIDALWNLVDVQQEAVMDAEELKNLGVALVVFLALKTAWSTLILSILTPPPPNPRSTKDSSRRHGYCGL